MRKSLDELVSEAESHMFAGWDFSYLEGRFVEGKPSWDYRSKVLDAVREVSTMLDIGTGGGELLASLSPLPRNTFATEPWEPNFEVARRRLEPLGARVIKVASENHLPFDSGYFELVIDRHEEFSSAEVYRILKPGGTFITQQVGGLNLDELFQLLQKPIHGRVTHPNPSLNLATISADLKAAGFRPVEGLEESFPSYFYDVGAVIYLLKHAPWEIPDFDAKKYREPLAAMHRRITEEGKLKVTSSRLYVRAKKPQ
jgi:SAM-dependent methyltransferase